MRLTLVDLISYFFALAAEHGDDNVKRRFFCIPVDPKSALQNEGEEGSVGCTWLIKK